MYTTDASVSRKLDDKDVVDVIGGRPEADFTRFVAELQRIRAIQADPRGGTSVVARFGPGPLALRASLHDRLVDLGRGWAGRFTRRRHSLRLMT